jgi:hypothetical protein
LARVDPGKGYHLAGMRESQVGRTLLRNIDLHPDGQRFAVAPAVDESDVKQDKVIFIFNFFDELRRIAPTN